MTEACSWTDHVIELQLWSRLAAYARFVHDHQIVLKCTAKALDFVESDVICRIATGKSSKDKKL